MFPCRGVSNEISTCDGLTSASASFLALEDPDTSSGSSSGSSFFSFFAPPPNIEKTLSLTPAAAEVAVEATLLANPVIVVAVDSGSPDLGSPEVARSSRVSDFVSVFADMFVFESRPVTTFPVDS